MTVYRHLTHAMAIMRREPDYRKWGPMIDALTPEEQAECRSWLRVQAEMARARQRARASKASRPASSAGSSSGRRKT